MKKSQGIVDLESLASTQWGMFTTAQARDLGIGRTQIARMVSASRIEPVSYATYRFVAGDVPSKADALAAWMSVYPEESVYERMKKRPYDAVASGRTAAYLHGIGDFHPEPYAFDLRVRKQTSRTDVKYRVHSWDEADVAIASGIPATSIEATVIGLLRDGEDPDHVFRLAADAVNKGHAFDVDRFAVLLDSLPRRTKENALLMLSRYIEDAIMQKALRYMREAIAYSLDSGHRHMAEGYLDKLKEFSERRPNEV